MWLVHQRLVISWLKAVKHVTDLLQLIGLEDFRDGHREAESLIQICVLLFKSHQAAPKHILIHLTQQRNTGIGL